MIVPVILPSLSASGTNLPPGTIDSAPQNSLSTPRPILSVIPAPQNSPSSIPFTAPIGSLPPNNTAVTENIIPSPLSVTDTSLVPLESS